MAYRVILAAAVLIFAAGCEKKVPETDETPDEETTAKEAAEEAEEAQAAREEEHGRPMDFAVSSDAFEDGGTLPKKFTCDGEGVSPPLTWSQAPEGTKSYAVVMTDPDAPDGTFHHWGVWAIPAEEHVLRQNVPNEAEFAVTTPDAPEGGVEAFQAKNDFGEIGYGAPCPPKGDEAHRYVFRVFALDHPGTTFTEPPSVEKLIDELSADAIGEASLVAKYQRAE